MARANQVQEKTSHAPEVLPPPSTSGLESKTLDAGSPLKGSAKPAAPLQDGTSNDLDNQPPEVSTELPPCRTPRPSTRTSTYPMHYRTSPRSLHLDRKSPTQSMMKAWISTSTHLLMSPSILKILRADVHTELMTPSSGRLSPTTLVDPEAGGSFLMPDYETEVDFLSDDVFDFTASSLLSTRSGQPLMPDFSEATEDDRSGEEILSILTKYTQFCLVRKYVLE